MKCETVQGNELESSYKKAIASNPADNRAKNKLFQCENFEHAQQGLQKLRPIALTYNCTPAQLALPWLIAQPQINAIAKARYPQQARDNALAAEIKLYLA
nr:aldo/keto reductase [Nostoc sp. TCL240-02]